MTKRLAPFAGNVPAGFTTGQLAHALSMQADSVRKRYWQTGSYFGVRPAKLPNGKLWWPADSLDRLLQASTTAVRRPTSA